MCDRVTSRDAFTSARQDTAMRTHTKKKNWKCSYSFVRDENSLKYEMTDSCVTWLFHVRHELLLCDVTYSSFDMTHSRSYLAESILISSWEWGESIWNEKKNYAKACKSELFSKADPTGRLVSCAIFWNMLSRNNTHTFCSFARSSGFTCSAFFCAKS